MEVKIPMGCIKGRCRGVCLGVAKWPDAAPALKKSLSAEGGGGGGGAVAAPGGGMGGQMPPQLEALPPHLPPQSEWDFFFFFFYFFFFFFTYVVSHTSHQFKINISIFCNISFYK